MSLTLGAVMKRNAIVLNTQVDGLAGTTLGTTPSRTSKFQLFSVVLAIAVVLAATLWIALGEPDELTDGHFVAPPLSASSVAPSH